MRHLVPVMFRHAQSAAHRPADVGTDTASKAEPIAFLRRDPSWLLLIGILAIALALRLPTIGFGLPALNDPDELMFETAALRMLRGPTLDPGWFGHPATTTIYLLALINIGAFATARIAGWALDPQGFADRIYVDPGIIVLPGRLAIMLFGLACIVLVWRLGRRLFGPTAGCAAALLLAVDPIHVTYSQIIRSDMMACTFMLLCLESAVTVAERASVRAHVRCALWLGLAIATKWPFALAWLGVVSASVAAVRSGVVVRRVAALRLVGASALAIGFLFLFSPYLLIDHATVLRNLRGEGQIRHLGSTSLGFWWNLRWYAQGPLLSGFGWIGGALLLVGIARLPRLRIAAVVLAPPAIGFVLLFSLQHLVWERWALPLMPLGALFAGFGVSEIAAFVHARGAPRAARWVGMAALAAAVPQLVLAVRADDRMRATDTRQLASAWARRHIPPGSSVLVEHFAFDLLDERWRFLFPMGDVGCIDALAYLHGKITYATIERARAGRAIVDYGTMPSALRPTCRADFAILTQYDRYRQERARFPAEYDAYRTLVAAGRTVATFEPHAGQIGGPVVTIVDLRGPARR